MHNLFSLYRCIGKLPFYARKNTWEKAYVRVDKLDFKRQLAFGDVFYIKKSEDGLISGAKTNDWCLKEFK